MELEKHFTTIDVHTGGEPLRIITGGIPPIRGKTMLEKRAYFSEHLDLIRKVLMHEPRGHEGMYGCIMTEPVSENAQFGVLFMHNEGLSTMCGHGIIAVVTAAVEMGIIEPKQANQPIVIDSPAGKITAFAHREGTRVKKVTFENVPSFVYQTDLPISLEGREFFVDVVFGGAFYGIVQASDAGVKVEKKQLARIKKLGSEIKRQIEEKITVHHPTEKDIKGIYGIMFSDDPVMENSNLRNVTVFANEQIDRSPCGTGTSGKAAALYHHGKLKIGERFIHESLIGSQFEATIQSTVTIGGFIGVIPTITGSAFVTGIHQFVVDPSDPLKSGFLLK